MHAAGPLVSVIVPTHNRRELLKETIASILNQTYSNFELIVVSDGSGDGTNEMVSKLEDSRVYLIQQAQSGQPAIPRNVGIKAANGSYIALCDDDDLWEQNKLAVQVEMLEDNQTIGMCYTNGSVLKNGTIHGTLNRRKVSQNHFNHLLSGNFIPNSSVMIRKIVFEKIGMINTDDFFRGIEDYEFWLRLSHEFLLKYIDQPLIQYRVHTNNITYSRSLETYRAIKVVKHINKTIKIPLAVLFPRLFIQYIKYWAYKLLLK